MPTRTRGIAAPLSLVALLLTALPPPATAQCPTVEYRCGRSPGSVLGNAPRSLPSKEECMTTCVRTRRCRGIWYNAALNQCHLLDRSAQQPGFARWYHDYIADRPAYVSAACLATTPTNLASGSDSDCGGVATDLDACEAMPAECRQLNINAVSQYVLQTSTKGSATDCARACLNNGNGCHAIHLASLGGTCTLFSVGIEDLSAGFDGTGTRGMMWTRGANMSTCGKLAEPDGWTCQAPCQAVTTAYGSVKFPQYMVPLLQTSNTVRDAAACAAVCAAFDSEGPQFGVSSSDTAAPTAVCKAFEYNTAEGTCTLYADALGQMVVDPTAGDSVVADMPDTTEQSKCLDVADPPAVNGGGSNAACPAGWTLRADTNVCYRLFGDGSSTYRARRGTITKDLEYRPRSKQEAEAMCRQQNATVAWVIDQAMNDFIVDNILGYGGTTWVNMERAARTAPGGMVGGGVAYDAYILPDLTDAGYLNFQDKRPGRGGGDCVVLQRARENPGATGGVGRWEEVHCNAAYPYVCERHAKPLAITTNGTAGELDPQRTLLIGIENTIDLYGEHFYADVLVTLQRTQEEHHTARANVATNCTVVKNITEVSIPLPITVIDEGHAQVVVPSTHPLVLGTVYSLCFAEQRPHPALPSEASQFQRYTGIDFTAIYTDYDRKDGKCAVRTGQVGAVVSNTPGAGP